MNAQSFKQFVAQHVVDGDPALSADHSAPSAFGQALWSSLLEKEKAQGSDKL